ncbi:hypothetical protein HKBW3S42_01350, partial [Candidatus Hakubella thermalkaliphila]
MGPARPYWVCSTLPRGLYSIQGYRALFVFQPVVYRWTLMMI